MKRIMLNNKSYLIFFIGVVLLFEVQCSQKRHDIEIWSLQNDSTVYIKIKNAGNFSCFLPENFSVSYSDISDTAYFEGINNIKSQVRNFYFYNQFADRLITHKILPNLKYDSVKIQKTQTDYFQFQAPRLVEIRPNEAMNFKVSFKLPRNIQFGFFRVYTNKYDVDSEKKHLSYHSRDDYIEFQKENSFLVFANIVPTDLQISSPGPRVAN
jgi:hypothetical protein